MSADFVIVPHPTLAAFGRAILEASKVPAATAALVADSLVASNLRGVDSHGIQLLLWYTDQIKNGNVDLHTPGHILSENGACMIYDADNGIGQLVSDVCCDHAIRMAA